MMHAGGNGFRRGVTGSRQTSSSLARRCRARSALGSAHPRATAPTIWRLKSVAWSPIMTRLRALARGSEPGSSPDGERPGFARLASVHLVDRADEAEDFHSLPPVTAAAPCPRHGVGDPEQGFGGRGRVGVLQRRSRIRPQGLVDHGTVALILAFARFEHEAAHPRSMQLGDRCCHEHAASTDLIAVIGDVDGRADVDGGHRPEQGAPALVALRCEVDPTLAAWKKGSECSTCTADIRRGDGRRADEVAPDACGFVDESVAGHPGRAPGVLPSTRTSHTVGDWRSIVGSRPCPGGPTAKIA